MAHTTLIGARNVNASFASGTAEQLKSFHQRFILILPQQSKTFVRHEPFPSCLPSDIAYLQNFRISSAPHSSGDPVPLPFQPLLPVKWLDHGSIHLL